MASAALISPPVAAARYGMRRALSTRVGGLRAAVGTKQRTGGRARRGLACCAALHEGPVVLHFFENCTRSPAFPNFTEGLYHCMEVARDHPNYTTSLMHEAINEDQGGEDGKTTDFSYMTLTLYSPVADGPDTLWTVNDGYAMGSEFGVAEPNHLAITTEIAALPAGTDSPLLTPTPSEQDVFPTAVFKEIDGPTALALASEMQALPGVSNVCLYKNAGDKEGGKAGLECCVRGEVKGPLSDDDLQALYDAFKALTADKPGLLNADLYRVLFTPTKDGPPIGILAAQKATEMAKERGMGDLEREVTIPQVQDKGEFDIMDTIEG